MGRKAGKYKKKENNDSKKKTTYHDEDNDDMMNDEIDACKLSLPFNFCFNLYFLVEFASQIVHWEKKKNVAMLFICGICWLNKVLFFWLIEVHKQRDIVPLDLDEDAGESDADFEHPVLDFEVYTVFLFPLEV